MNTAPPPQPPYGTLIELARKGARLSMQAAARRAGISKGSWIDIVRQYRVRNGEPEHIEPKAETIAAMAHAVGITPERLESEGERPDAAGILREIQRGEAPPRPEPVRPVAGDEADTDPAADLFPGDEVLQAIWRQTGVSEENRAAQVRAIRLARERALDEGRRTAGLAAHGEPALADIL